MSFSPHLIIINEVDQRKVTRRARKIAAVLEIVFEKIVTSIFILLENHFPINSFIEYARRNTANIFFKTPSGRVNA